MDEHNIQKKLIKSRNGGGKNKNNTYDMRDSNSPQKQSSEHIIRPEYTGKLLCYPYTNAVASKFIFEDIYCGPIETSAA